MVDEVLGEADSPPLGDRFGYGHTSMDATQRACAIIAALQADGRVATPKEVARLIYMLQRVIARPIIDDDLLRSQGEDGGRGESPAR